MDSDQELRSLRRGLTALILINQREAMSIARMARALDVPRTTAERVLNTLAVDGFLERSPVDKQYRLTHKVLELSSGFAGDNWIVHVAGPMLAHLTEEIGWPLAIATPEGIDMRVRYTTDTMTTLWLNRRRVGASIPMAQASSGMVYLAFTSPAERDQICGLIAEADHEVRIDPAVLRNTLRDGYAFSPRLTRERSIAVPVMVDGTIRAVLVMMYMARVLTEADVLSRYLDRLTALAASIGDKARGHV